LIVFVTVATGKMSLVKIAELKLLQLSMMMVMIMGRIMIMMKRRKMMMMMMTVLLDVRVTAAMEDGDNN